MWKEFPEEDKTPYDKLAAADKARYEKEVIKLNACLSLLKRKSLDNNF